MARKSKAPWGDLLGKPIERLFRRDDPSLGEWAKNDAVAEQRRKMVRLKQYYGIEGEIGYPPTGDDWNDHLREQS